MTSGSSHELPERLHHFFHFNFKVRVSFDELKNTTIKALTPSAPVFLDNHQRERASSGKKDPMSFSSFVSWLCGPKRHRMPFLQHFIVQLGLVQVVERFLKPQEEIDASAWYVREILASWHRLVGLSRQLNDATHQLFKKGILNQLSQGMITITMNGLLSGIEDSSSVPLCLIPGGMLFRVTEQWVYHQNHYMNLLDEALMLYHESLDQQAQEDMNVPLSEFINEEALLSIPLLHHLHYLIPSRVSVVRKRLLEQHLTREVIRPSTVPRSDVWLPPPLLKNSKGRWSDLVYVLLHLMHWELQRIQALLLKLGHVDSSTWHVNWSSIQFPLTRLIVPCWSSEGAFFLRVGLLPNRYFQFVQPILPHGHVLALLLNAMVRFDPPRLKLVPKIATVLFPSSTIDLVKDEGPLEV